MQKDAELIFNNNVIEDCIKYSLERGDESVLDLKLSEMIHLIKKSMQLPCCVIDPNNIPIIFLALHRERRFRVYCATLFGIL